MHSTPPPLPPKSRVGVSSSGETNVSSRVANSDSGIAVALIAFLVLIVAFLLVLAMWYRDAANLPVSNGEMGDPMSLQVEDDSPFDSSSGDESEVASSEHSENPEDSVDVVEVHGLDGLENQAASSSESGSDSENAFKTASNLSDESPVEPIELQSDSSVLPTIPIVRNRSTSLPATIVGSDGQNPFLTGLDAASIAFVIDQSGSMAGDRLARVCRAVIEAINQLTPSQEYIVIFFSDGFEVHPKQSRLVKASRANRKAIEQWVATVQSSGGTHPFDSVSYALQQNPERIILLSDGEFDPLVAEMITEINQRRSKPIRIDGIGLSENVVVLQELARKNDGTYFPAR